MHLHFLLAIALILSSSFSWAGPTYEVTFLGEEPVLVQLDDTGRTWVGSKKQVLDVSALTVRIESLNTRGSYLLVTTHVTRPVLLKTVSQGAEVLIPTKAMKTLKVSGAVSKVLMVPNPDCLAPCRALVAIRRKNSF